MILKVGLTGGIASGKSTVGRILEELGCLVFDADRIVHELYQPGEEGHRRLAEHYGEEILDETGSIDRPRLASIALETPETVARLNGLIHPLVIAREEEIYADLSSRSSDAIMVVEATLLLEAGGKDRYDRIVAVDIDPGLQMERAVGRGMESDETARRMARQMPREERLESVDYVIRNDGTLGELEEETRRIHDLLLRDLEEKKSRE